MERCRWLLPIDRERAERLEGATVTAVEARGKALLTEFADDAGALTLYSHNNLYGRWHLDPASRSPRSRRSLRLELVANGTAARLYSATDVALLTPEELSTHPFLLGLGPDVCAPLTGEHALLEQLEHPRFRGRALGSLLLDQGFMAGVGNYLRSEILFDAGTHPAERPGELDLERARLFVSSALDVCERAVLYGGVTVDPARLPEGPLKRRPRPRHAVFGREGQPCPRCGAPIVKLAYAGRRLYLCERCQPHGNGPHNNGS